MHRAYNIRTNPSKKQFRLEALSLADTLLFVHCTYILHRHMIYRRTATVTVFISGHLIIYYMIFIEASSLLFMKSKLALIDRAFKPL